MLNRRRLAWDPGPQVRRVLICNGPEIVLRCGTCSAEIKYVGYDPGQPWLAAEALGWRIAEGPRGKPGWIIAARNPWPRLAIRMNRWMSSATIRRRPTCDPLDLIDPKHTIFARVGVLDDVEMGADRLDL